MCSIRRSGTSFITSRIAANTDHHGTALTLNNGSLWTVTDDSQLDSLAISADSQVVYGTATVDGVSVTLEPGRTYEGDIVITAAAAGGAYEIPAFDPNLVHD